MCVDATGGAVHLLLSYCQVVLFLLVGLLSTGTEVGHVDLFLRGNGGDFAIARPVVLSTDGNGVESAIRLGLPEDGASRNRVPAIQLLRGGPVECVGDDGLQVGQFAKLVIKSTAILPGDVVRVDVLLERLLHVCFREDEDLGLLLNQNAAMQGLVLEYTYNCNRIEPSLDPAPNSGEEGRGANNEDSVQSLWVMCSGKCTRILHMGLQTPELLQSHIGDVDDVA